MSWFFHRKEDAKNTREDNISSVEVTRIKRKGHKAIIEADDEIIKVNRLLRTNRITLKIHIASGNRQ